MIDTNKQRAMKRGILSQMREESQPFMAPSEPVTDSAGNTDEDLLGLFDELTGGDTVSSNRRSKKKRSRLAYVDKSSRESSEDDGSDEDGAILPIPVG